MAENTAETPNVRVMLQGQSNCWGKGSLSELDGLTDGLSAFKEKAFERVFIMCRDGEYEALHVGVNNEAAFRFGFGCEFGLAVRWERETKDGNLYIEKQYIDGAPIRYFLKDGTCSGTGCPGPEKGAFFNSLLEKRKNTNQWLKNKNISYRDVAWIWVQGEGDADTSVSDYLKYLEEYSKSLMSSSPLLLPGTAWKILVLLKPDDVSGPVRNPDKAKVEFKGRHSETTRLIPPTDNYLKEDNPDWDPRTHLNGKGLVQLGYDAFEKIFGASHLTVESL